MNTYAIGDIHGCLNALNKLLLFAPVKPGDQLVFLGDYIDRGSDSKGVIDRVIELGLTFETITLRGNHEVMMLDSRTDSTKFRMWRRYGGDTALASYNVEESPFWKESIPDFHWEFLLSTLPYFETESHIFVHANLNPQRPLNDQNGSDLYWRFCDDMKPHRSGRHIICGHTSQKSGIIKEMGFATCIDTFVAGGQWLTMLNVDTGDYWQANESGDCQGGGPIHMGR